MAQGRDVGSGRRAGGWGPQKGDGDPEMGTGTWCRAGGRGWGPQNGDGDKELVLGRDQGPQCGDRAVV